MFESRATVILSLKWSSCQTIALDHLSKHLLLVGLKGLNFRVLSLEGLVLDIFGKSSESIMEMHG